ncbi:hypothetical protein BDU57DRAFT_540717 [Ampelomyces quisqualis]|uniref:Chromo domain-containing protein n=1 Tax=Ampelomyces quisqualis TaxID=50730 RepID=A0A6A5QJI4_AMPQU|nr:hypothetical protein BDU57DRAFT_540717 [Ampelomyces quisqualis]
MSVRGPRGGRGRRKATTWEWHNNYVPGPEVYNQLWHLRREPVIVTPFLPTKCPVNAQSRIIDRRQTEGVIQRNFYVVEVKHSQTRDISSSTVESNQQGTKETLHVDLSRILDYVSPDELERFENGQFRIEAEAEAVAVRAHAEELAQKRLQKNARAAATGHGHGIQDTGEARLRGRSRGRGRGRGRGSWRGTSTLVERGRLLSEHAQEELELVEHEEDIPGDEEAMNLAIAETDSEVEDDLVRSSPVIARSAFVANSALPVSPILLHQPSSINRHTLPDEVEESSEVESDIELEDADNRSTSSVAMQLRIEHNTREHSDISSEGEDLHNEAKYKRRRTQSTTSDLPASFAKAALVDSHHSDSMPRRVSPVPETSRDTESSDSDNYDASDQHRPMQIPPTNGSLQNHSTEDMESTCDQAYTPDAETRHEQAGEGEEQDADEYVVENIIEHYREAGTNFFLVKWQGFDESYDWLPEEALEGAAELVAEYKHRVRKREGKKKMK